MTLEFSDIIVHKLFHCNGNDYQKNSSRTARLLSNGMIFYFSKKELVHPISW